MQRPPPPITFSFYVYLHPPVSSICNVMCMTWAQNWRIATAQLPWCTAHPASLIFSKPHFDVVRALPPWRYPVSAAGVPWTNSFYRSFLLVLVTSLLVIGKLSKQSAQRFNWYDWCNVEAKVQASFQHFIEHCKKYEQKVAHNYTASAWLSIFTALLNTMWRSGPHLSLK